jgi:hypothetical protein
MNGAYGSNNQLKGRSNAVVGDDNDAFGRGTRLRASETVFMAATTILLEMLIRSMAIKIT